MGGQGDTRVARPTLYYAIEAPDGTEVYPKKQDGTDGAWRWKKEKVEAEKDRLEWVDGRNGWTPYYRIYAAENSTRPPETIWTHGEVGSNRTAKAEIKAVLPEVEAFATPKPERLIQRILEIGTQPGDLVLDFFVGSGTTAAVAHKMGRRYIAVEQMDYINTVTVPRLRKVIGGEPGGISKAQNWTGGGVFLYFEMKEDNAGYVARVEAAPDTAALLALYAEMQAHEFLRLEVDPEKWDAATYAAMSLDEQKRVLLDCLDKNRLYVNLTEMEDADHGLSAADIALNHTFYGLSATAE